MDLSDIATVKSVLARHGIRLSKSMGQNFLIDPAVCPRMAAACGADERTGVLEIGPGAGVLTASLARKAAKVLSVELDASLFPVLRETLAEFQNVRIVQGDAMKIDLCKLIQEEFAGLDAVVCANLPYYITSPVILRFLEERIPVSSLTVMVQKEAAARLCAPPGTRACGAVSASVACYAEPEILFQVPRTSFLPPPNVDSAVMRLRVRKEPLVPPEKQKAFFALVGAAFRQRRKTVLNSISAGLGISKENIAAALQEQGIVQTVRAEQLTMEQLMRLSEQLSQRRKKSDDE